MKHKITYSLGCLILFLGLLWLFIPHTAHVHIAETIDEHADEEKIGTHIINILFGIILTITGLTIISTTNKKEENKINYLNKIIITLSISAGLIHTVAIKEHFTEWIGYGYFFIIVAIAQITYAIIIWKSEEINKKARNTIYILGIAGNLLIITLYLITRTVGIPILGPLAGQTEAVGIIDITSKIIEIGIITYTTIIMKVRNNQR